MRPTGVLERYERREVQRHERERAVVRDDGADRPVQRTQPRRFARRTARRRTRRQVERRRRVMHERVGRVVRIDPLEPLVITIGTIKGGDRNNIIAEEVKMEGTMRTLNDSVRTQALELMRQTLANVTSAYGAKFELSVDDSNPVTYNEPQLVDRTLPTIRRIVGDTNVLALKPFMPAEDFSYYQKVIPGFFFFLGVGNKSKGLTPAWHTADFDVDEESLVVGVKVMANVLLDYLDRNGR